MTHEKFINRLREIIKFKFEMSIKKYAEIANINESLLGKYLKGNADPGLTNIEKLAKAANLSLSEFFLDKPYQEIITHETEMVTIPVYDIRASAGGGAINETAQIKDVVAFRYDWIKTRYRANISDLFLMFVDGDSMEPTLRHRDIILVNKREAEYIRDGIYVLKTDGNLQAKRIARLGGHIIKIISDNPTYPSQEKKIEKLLENEIQIIGKVIWLGRQL